MRQINHHEALSKHYQIIIVGSGFAGSILAKELSGKNYSVLVVEAGTGDALSFGQHLDYVDRYRTATIKIPNAPFPNCSNAPQPMETDVEPVPKGGVSAKGYFVQTGPYPFASTFTRRVGGTSLHWFGSCPRMVPDDFAMRSVYGVAVDWPIDYDFLQPFYEKAEREIGVSANVQDQQYLGIHFSPGYVYPMERIPQSYLDGWFSKGLANMRVDELGEPVMVRSIPQARNSIPNPRFDGGEGFTPKGAVGDPSIGQRCMGNSSCLPICPVQARYNSLKTLQHANVDLLTKTVVSKLDIDPDNGRIRGLECKVWRDDRSADFEAIYLKADTFILAANAIQNATLLLASGACKSSGQLGRNLMDHPAILSWGLAPEAIGAFRGPGLTSTLVNYRNGKFRRERAGFVLEIGNWGWNWPFNDPNDTTIRMIDEQHAFGRQLRDSLTDMVPRQVRIDMMTEQLPSDANRVEISPDWRDALGNFRPVLQYNVDDYSKQGMVFARDFGSKVFKHLGIADETTFDPSSYGYFDWKGNGYVWQGVGHIAGTHRMGTDRHNSVVDRWQRAWDHENLYVTGCGSMPTLGTSNPTITMAALCFATATRF
ncbi:GMC family oxidoreductase [Parachitinimonas caeni]|uniref:GMC family oxidoreductase n=1 Tax=Parachitinimonas caeni TaxID=3031301 RepID=A0ABT7DWD8_9NEIS|nr:GMC family oxidoreductase [Parachitinimonas caeni]MDK2124372.1 GMC family oxidoreductase [Parachitinimonas caeni]